MPRDDENGFAAALGRGIANFVVIPLLLVVAFFEIVLTTLPRALGAFFSEFGKEPPKR